VLAAFARAALTAAAGRFLHMGWKASSSLSLMLAAAVDRWYFVAVHTHVVACYAVELAGGFPPVASATCRLPQQLQLVQSQGAALMVLLVLGCYPGQTSGSPPQLAAERCVCGCGACTPRAALHTTTYATQRPAARHTFPAQPASVDPRFAR